MNYAIGLVKDAINQRFGFDIQVFQSQTNASNLLDKQTLGFGPLSVPLFNPGDHAKLDRYLGIDPAQDHTGTNGDLGNGVRFDHNQFAAFADTVTMGKLLLLDGDQMNRVLQDLTSNPFYALYDSTVSGHREYGNIMTRTLPGVLYHGHYTNTGPGGNASPDGMPSDDTEFTRLIDGDHGWRSNGNPIFSPADTTHAQVGNGNFPLWASCLLRDKAFRVLFKDWENGALNFPDLGDSTSHDLTQERPPKVNLGANGVLTITGTPIADTLSVTSGESGKDIVISRGDTNLYCQDSESFSLASVTKVVINGLDGNDTITIAPDVPTNMDIDGGGGSDTYNISFTGSGSRTITIHNSGTGVLTVSGTSGGNILVLTPQAIIRGSETVNYDNTTKELTVNGGAGNDFLTVDLSKGGLLPSEGVVFKGGDQISSPGDSMEVIGNGQNTSSYTPSKIDSGSGRVVVDGKNIDFTGLDLLTIDNMANCQFITPNNLDVLTVNSPASGQNRISGTSDSVSLEPLTFFGIAAFTIDASSSDTTALAGDSITIDRSGFVARGLKNLSILTGKGSDTLTIQSSRFSLPVPAGTFTFDGGEGLNTITSIADVNYTLTDTNLSSSAGGTVTLKNFIGGRANLTGGPSSNSFDVSGWTGTGTLEGQSGTGDTVVAVNDTDFTLTDTSLERSGRGKLALSHINVANLTGGAGDNIFTLSGWSGTGTLDGGVAGTDTIVADNDTNSFLTDSSLGRDGRGELALKHVQVARLTGGVGDNTFSVSDWTGHAFLDGKEGSDSYTVAFKGSNSGTTTITDTGAMGTDSVTVIGTPNDDTLLVKTGTVARATETVNFSGLEKLTVDGTGGKDTFNVQSTATSTPVTVYGRAGNDTVNISSDAGTNNGDVDSILGMLTVDTGPGANRMVVSNFMGNPRPNVILDTTTIGNQIFQRIRNLAAADINYSASGGSFTNGPTNDGILLRGSNNGGDTFNVRSSLGGSTTKIEGNNGNDVFNISSDAPASMGSLDGIQGTLTVEAGAGEANRLIASNFGGAASGNTVVTNNAITGFAPATIFYSAPSGHFTNGATNDGILLRGSDHGADVFNVQSNLAGSATKIEGNGGDDSIAISNTARSLDDIRGTLTVDAGSGSNILTVDDFGGGPHPAVTLTSSQITGLAPAIITYFATGGSFRAITVDGSDRDDLPEIFNLQSPNGPFTLNANGGDDTVNVQSLLPRATIHLGAGNDTANVSVARNSAYTLLLIDGGPRRTTGIGDVLNVFDVAGGAVVHDHRFQVGGGTVEAGYLTGAVSYIDYENMELVVPTPDAEHSFVQSLYHQFLKRDGSGAELDHWVSILHDQGSQSVVANAVMRSPEARTLLVKSWYTKYLGREAGGGEEQSWVHYLLAGRTDEDVLSSFLNSREFFNRVQFNPQGLIQMMYLDILSRTADPIEAFYWLNSLSSTGGRGGLAWLIQSSIENRSNVVLSEYNDVLRRGNVSSSKSHNSALLSRPEPSQSEVNSWVFSRLDLRSIDGAFASTDEFFAWAF